MPSQINIVHSIASLAASDGGPSYTVTALSNAQQGLTSGSVHILSGQLSPGKDVIPDDHVTVHGINRRWPASQISTRIKLAELLSIRNTVLHDQGIWHPHNLAASGFAARHDMPYVISTHGMLEPWTLKHHALRKKLARWLYQDRLLSGANCLMATSEPELSSIRDAGFFNPVAVIANGIDSEVALPLRTAPSHPKTLLFLSRLHAKKGLIHLIDAWHTLRPSNWQLLIVGPSEEGHREELQNRVREYKLQTQITFRDAVTGNDKYQCYRNADVFVLPSYSENFGVVVAEALACGLPVITTTGTPWSGLLDHDCGWYINTGTEPLVAALREVFTTTDKTRMAMGERGRQWMRTSFQWSAIAAHNIAVYEWILGLAEIPSCVNIDKHSLRTSILPR
ncbi:MAG: glycosyltransferase [Steroidobacteraceae bacterium]